jgi:streptogramin lyase
MTITRHLAIGVAASALFFAAQSAHAVPNPGTIEGVVKNAAGQPVSGAYVKLKNTDGRLTFLVASQAGGKFTAGDLPPGQYTIQGIGAGFTSAVSVPLNVDANKTAKAADITLANKQGPVLPGAWPGRLPEEEHEKVSLVFPAGAGKALVEEKCTTCHNDNRIVVKRSEPADWAFTIKRMRINLAGAGMPDLTEQEATTITKYLADNYKPLAGVDENARMPRTLATGDATKFRVVTYNLPRPYSEPHDIAVDPTGVAWAAERAGFLIRFDPKLLEFTERPIPAGIAAPDRQRLGNPQIDSKGMLWAADGPNNRWLSYDTVNRQYKTYPWTEKGHGNAGGNSMTIHPNGKIYATGFGREVRMLDPATLQWKFFEAPAFKAKGEPPGAYGVAVAGDGAVWFAENDADLMARVDVNTGKVEEFKIPYDGYAMPRRLQWDANGDIWVGLWQEGKLMKIDHKTNKMTIYNPPTPNNGAYVVATDKKQGGSPYIWFSEQKVDRIGRFDPRNGQFVEFPLPYAESDARRVEIDPTNPNRVFFSGNTADRIGFVEYLP